MPPVRMGCIFEQDGVKHIVDYDVHIAQVMDLNEE